MSESQDILELLQRLRMDLTNAQGKLTDVQRMIAALNLPGEARPTCDVCGLTFRGPLSLAEHLHNAHQGPLPGHWLRAEQLAGLDIGFYEGEPRKGEKLAGLNERQHSMKHETRSGLNDLSDEQFDDFLEAIES